MLAILTSQSLFAWPQDIAGGAGALVGQDIIGGGATKHTLYVSNDNDFLSTTKNDKGTSPNNPNRFFVFSFTDVDLPGFVQQKFDCEEDRDHDGHGGFGRFDGPGFGPKHFVFPFFWPKHGR